MAITQAVRLEYASNTPGTAYTTTSASPVGGRLLLLHVSSGTAGVNPPQTPSTVTGNGLTWVKVTDLVGANAQLFGSLWRAMGTTPTAGAVTVNFAAAVDTIVVKMVEFAGVDTTGTNGSGAVRQFNQMTGSTTTPSVTLPSAIVAGNTTAGFLSYNAAVAQTMTAGTGYTKVGNDLVTTPAHQTSAEWRTDGITTVNYTTLNASNKVLIGVELVGTANVPPTAEAGPDQANVEPFTTVTLDSSGSVDPDGTIVSRLWTPPGGVTLSSNLAVSPTFTAPATMDGVVLTFSVTVTDNAGATSAADTVGITVLPWDQWVRVGGAWVPRRNVQVRAAGAWV